MKLHQKLLAGVVMCVTIMAANFSHAAAETETDRIVNLLLTPPVIAAQPGFSAKLLVPPGQIYDPFYPFVHDGAIWVVDMGPNVGTTGGRVLSIDERGNVTTIVPPTTSNTMISGYFAPPGFGRFAGKLILVSQPNSTSTGSFVNQVVQQLDPAKRYAPTVICTLPAAGTMGKGVAGISSDTRFGPPNSAFANRLFTGTMLNAMMYQMDSTGKCTPFANFTKYGLPTGIQFTPDGKQMLVTTAGFDFGASASGALKPGAGLVLRVSPEGKIDPRPLATGFDTPAGLAFAPPGFGAYAGQIFLADAGPVLQYPPPSAERLTSHAKIFRITPDGRKHLVATGFINPLGVQFFHNQLWVTDMNAIYAGAYGGRELPDGFITVITAK